MIADVVILVIIAIFLFVGLYRGAAATVLNIAGLIVSMLIAGFAAEFLAEFIYTEFISEQFIANIEQAIAEGNLSLSINNCLDELPGFISSIITPVLVIFGLSSVSSENLLPSTENFSQGTAAAIEKSVSPLVINALCFILNIVLFFIILIIVKWLIKILLNLFKIPVINEINKLLGALLGLAEGVIFVFIAVNIYYTVICGADSALISEAFTDGYLFKLFCISV